MNDQFQNSNCITSLRRLHSTYSFRIDDDADYPEIAVWVWELMNENLKPDYRFEAEVSHEIQNSKQAEPYSPMPIETSPERAFEMAVYGFMQMYDGSTTKITKRKAQQAAPSNGG